MRSSQNKYDAKAIHDFAHKIPLDASRSTQQVYQSGMLLCSYGSHFPIGFHLNDVFFITSDRWGGRCSRTDWHVWLMGQSVQHDGVKKVIRVPMMRWQDYPVNENLTSDTKNKKNFLEKTQQMYDFFASRWVSSMKESINSMAKSIKPNTYESHRGAFLQNLQDHDAFISLFASHFKNKIKVKVSKEIEILREALNKSKFRGVDTGDAEFEAIKKKHEAEEKKRVKSNVLRSVADAVSHLTAHEELRESFLNIKKLKTYSKRQENYLLIKDKRDFNIFERSIIDKLDFICRSLKSYPKDVSKMLDNETIEAAKRINFAFRDEYWIGEHFIKPTLDEEMFQTTLGNRVSLDEIKEIVKMYNSTIPKDKMVGKHIKIKNGGTYKIEECDEKHIKIGCHVFTRETIDIIDKHLVSPK